MVDICYDDELKCFAEADLERVFSLVYDSRLIASEDCDVVNNYMRVSFNTYVPFQSTLLSTDDAFDWLSTFGPFEFVPLSELTPKNDGRDITYALRLQKSKGYTKV